MDDRVVTQVKHSSPSDGRPGIGLAMIVKNEAAVIERALVSVLPLIDTWTIVDTGSTDGTQDVIRRVLTGLPGTLHERPWVDFGTNRSELMDLAHGTARHLLTIDADMTVRIDGEFGPLDDRDYLVTHAGRLAYKTPRLLRGDIRWRYVGVTHEYLTSDEAGPIDSVLPDMVIEHHADGGSRADKFTRDRRLLEPVVAADPTDTRAVFYLAQTYADLGETDLAIEGYRRRVALEGWNEERFWSQLRIGDLLATDDWTLAVGEYLAAWQLRPTRAEPLYRLARGYRIRGDHALAEFFARAGLDIPFPTDDRLFVEREPYDWGLRFELSIATYWTGHSEASLQLCDALLDDPLPETIRPWVRLNRDVVARALGIAEP